LKSVNVNESVTESVSITLPRRHPLQQLRLGSQSVLPEKWKSMKITTMMQKRIRKVESCQLLDQDLDRPLERPK
jgi:hypothetical protein